jgi:hypothetical protein
MKITEINALLTKALQQKCRLEDDLTLFYKFKFPEISSITQFEELKNNCESFLSQYDIKTDAGVILYPKKANKIFVLKIHKLPLDQFIEKLTLISKDSQLYEAVNQGDVLSVKMLLDKNNFNNKNIVGDTLLHTAMQGDSIAIVSLLLEEGASINVVNKKGETPLQIVDQKKDILLGKKLIDVILYREPNTKNPNFIRQELRDYWNEQLKELWKKSSYTLQIEDLRERTEIVQEIQNVGNNRQFFSLENPLNDNKPLQEPPTTANLGK